jgi:hypothetical protein
MVWSCPHLEVLAIGLVSLILLAHDVRVTPAVIRILVLLMKIVHLSAQVLAKVAPQVQRAKTVTS